MWEAGPPPDAEPVIAWDRIAANIAWWRLFRQELRFEAIDIVGPYLAVDRLATGDLNLAALLPEAPPPSPDADPAPAPDGRDAGWGVAVDRLRLERGSLRFRDFMVAGAEPVEIALPEISLAQVAVGSGSYAEPGRLRLALGIDRGRLHVDAALAMTEQGPEMDARIRAVRLPLRRTRVYVPSVGLTDLLGETGVALRVRYDVARGPRLGGTVLVDGLTLTAEGLPEPALAWRRLRIRIGRLALDDQRAVLREVRLDGPTLLLRPAHAEPVPLLAVLRASEPTAAAADSAEPPAGPPWRWAVDRVTVDDLRLVLLGEGRRLEGTGRIEARDLSGPEPATVPLVVDLGLNGGTARAEGQVTLAPTSFSGTVSIASLSLPEPLTVAALVPPGVVRAGTLGLDLTVDAAPTAGRIRVLGHATLDTIDGAWPTPDRTRASAARLTLADMEVAIPAGGAVAPLAAKGKVSVEGLTVTSAVPSPLSLAVERLVLAASDALLPFGEAAGPMRAAADLVVDSLSVRGADGDESGVTARRLEVRGVSVQSPSGGTSGPLRLTVDSVRLAEPAVTAVRTEAGLRLPGVEPAPATTEGNSAGTLPASASPASGSPAASAAPASEILVGSLRLGEGRLSLVDRAVRPHYRGGVQGLRVEMDRLRLPQASIERLRLEASAAGGGRLRASGALGTRDGRLELTLDQLALPPFNPYATAASPYSVRRGRLSLTTDATRRSDRISARSRILLHDLDLGGAEGDTLFQQQFGIPLTVALALLRDLDGDIVLDVPLESDAAGTRVGIGTVIAGALRQALLGALTSPLKLAGSLFGGGSAEPTAPQTLAFAAGRDTLLGDTDEQLDGLGRLLANRPGLVLRLGTAAAPADVRWLAEQDVHAALREPRGLLGTVGGLTERGVRSRVAAALEARARGDTGALEDRDAEMLERWIAERPAPSAERIAALGKARIARVRAVLAERYGIPASRVLEDDPPEDTPATPSVVVRLGAAG